VTESGKWSRGVSGTVRRAVDPSSGGDDAPLPPEGDAHAAIEAHFTRVVGLPAYELHDVASPNVKVHIHVVAPSPAHRAWTLYTTGMSDAPMLLPRGIDAAARAEVMIRLPPSWPAGRGALDAGRGSWPLRWLKQLARLPQDFDTWLGPGHTVPNGEPAAPLGPGTKQCCVLVTEPESLPAEARVMRLGSGEVIAIYALVPIYEDEMDLKLREGAAALASRLAAAGVGDLVDPARRSVAGRAKLFGLF
jgi:hypothetical protein